MKKINLTTIISFLLLVNISCAEKCPNNIELANYYLSEKSKKIFPYQNGEEKLIFKDSLNNSILFNIDTSNEVYLSESNWNEQCTLNDSTNNQINIKAKREWRTVRFIPDSLINISFNIFLKQEVDIDASNLDNIREFDNINIYRSNVSQMAIITDLKNTILNESPTERVKEITINGKEYENLLKSKWTNSGDIYYDVKNGIIAINEHQGGYKKAKYWTLDSIVYKK